MSENNREERTSISKASTPQQIGEFWDSHSLADYSENVHEVSLELDARLTDGRAASVSASRKNTLEKSGTTRRMRDKFSRICWNTAGWKKPTGDAAKVETTSYVATHHFGHEEWLFNSEWLIDGYRYGFLQPILKYYRRYKGHSCSILLYTVTPERDTLLVAKIANVHIPEEDELDRVLRKYESSGWMDSMRADVEVIGGCLTVLDNPKPVEVVNIRFQPENVTRILDPRRRVVGGHKIARNRRYHPFDWDGIFLKRKWHYLARRRRSCELGKGRDHTQCRKASEQVQGMPNSCELDRDNLSIDCVGCVVYHIYRISTSKRRDIVILVLGVISISLQYHLTRRFHTSPSHERRFPGHRYD